MKRALLVLAALVVGALIGSAGTLGLQQLHHEDEEVLRGLAYGGSTDAKANVGTSYTFDGGSVCVTGGFGRITAIRPRHAQGGLTVTNFKLVDDIMTNRPTDVVTTRCKDNSDDGQRLFVTVKADELPAAADGYVIDYVIDGRKATTTSANWALLCDPTKKRGVTYGSIIPKCYD
jgi:hypothetical protein